MFNFGHRVGVFIGEVCACVCVGGRGWKGWDVRVCGGGGGDGDGKWLGDVRFTSDFYHARLTHYSNPICK